MEVSALSNGEIVNYNNIAMECGISAPTVKEYFSILEKTLIGYMISAFTQKVKRRVIQSPRFYYFDVGIANFLLKSIRLNRGSPEFDTLSNTLSYRKSLLTLGISSRC